MECENLAGDWKITTGSGLYERRASPTGQFAGGAYRMATRYGG